jgi:hypothetical protein
MRGREALKEFLGGEDWDGAAGEAGGVASDQPVCRAGCGGGCLKGIFIIGDSIAKSGASFRVSEWGNLSETQDLVDARKSNGVAGFSLGHVENSGQAVSGEEKVDSEKVATLEHSGAGGEKWKALVSDIDEDVCIEEEAHVGLGAVFLPIRHSITALSSIPQ